MPINKRDTTEIAVSRRLRRAAVIMLRRDKQEATNCLQWLQGANSDNGAAALSNNNDAID